ncbi:hypothetical protein H9638_02065 [Arthrobacter sp. Sa2BUA2]|uniref:DUF4365 domain-containing protein n=1 Tax=Arthrobacter pullicola TaxID=2762224 RepID=A0ABR8YEF4_9MICC|nr:hypothetical protein [Arthrobacter pullicola]MBD8042589.1 hypothetical protein [Arthrobacter pullicola]
MEHIRIFTAEPMATRALAAEIRHAPDEFVKCLRRLTGAAGLDGFQSVRCEASEQLDLELAFSDPSPCTVGIEAKLDHELTRDQMDRQLGVVDHLVLLLTAEESAPEWVAGRARVYVMTWADALACFEDSRLTLEDINLIPVPKSRVEARFRAQNLRDRLPGWRVDVQRGGSGMPAIEIESQALPNGRTLRGQIQIVGREMPEAGRPIRIEYSIGVSVAPTEEEYPDPESSHVEPGWIEPLRALRREVLDGDEERLLVSLRKPGNGRSGLGVRKLPLAQQHLADATWLAKGYTDGWALGIKSNKWPLEDLDRIVSATVEIFSRWYEVEQKRLGADLTNAS